MKTQEERKKKKKDLVVLVKRIKNVLNGLNKNYVTSPKPMSLYQPRVASMLPARMPRVMLLDNQARRSEHPRTRALLSCSQSQVQGAPNGSA